MQRTGRPDGIRDMLQILTWAEASGIVTTPHVLHAAQQGSDTMSRESKFLSRVLHHQPEMVGLSLGPGGWVPVDDLLRGMKKARTAPACAFVPG